MTDLTAWQCEKHPGTIWPHGDCPGPGMPLWDEPQGEQYTLRICPKCRAPKSPGQKWCGVQHGSERRTRLVDIEVTSPFSTPPKEETASVREMVATLRAGGEIGDHPLAITCCRYVNDLGPDSTDSDGEANWKIVCEAMNHLPGEGT